MVGIGGFAGGKCKALSLRLFAYRAYRLQVFSWKTYGESCACSKLRKVEKVESFAPPP